MANTRLRLPPMRNAGGPPQPLAGGRGVITGTGLAVFLAVAHLATDGVTSTFAALLPILQARFGLAESALAGLVATLALGSSLAQPLFGALADRFGGRTAAALGAIVSASLLSLVPLVPSVGMLVALLAVGGLGSAAFHPAAAGIAHRVGEGKRELAVGLFSAGGMVGVALGPVMVLALVAAYGLAAVPWLMVPAVLLGLATFVAAPLQPPAQQDGNARLFDVRLIAGPVGLLALVGILIDVVHLSVTSALPLWLVTARGVARDSALIGWTLAAFSIAAAVGGIGAGLLTAYISRRSIVASSLLLAPLPLFALYGLEPGSVGYFGAVALGGALVSGSFPLLVVSAQELAPRAVAAASGMLMGFTMGIAGLVYLALGQLQQSIGLEPALGVGYLSTLPAAVIAFVVLSGERADGRAGQRAVVAAAVVGGRCGCANVYGVAHAAADARSSANGAEPACACAPHGGHSGVICACAQPA